MLSGIALACSQRCNEVIEFIGEPCAKHLSAYIYTCVKVCESLFVNNLTCFVTSVTRSTFN